MLVYRRVMFVSPGQLNLWRDQNHVFLRIIWISKTEQFPPNTRNSRPKKLYNCWTLKLDGFPKNGKIFWFDCCRCVFFGIFRCKKCEFLLGASQYGRHLGIMRISRIWMLYPQWDAAQGALACAPPKTFKTLEYEIWNEEMASLKWWKTPWN